MPDGSDLISDWPYLNGLLNASGMCDLIAIQANRLGAVLVTRDRTIQASPQVRWIW